MKLWMRVYLLVLPLVLIVLLGCGARMLTTVSTRWLIGSTRAVWAITRC